MWDEVFSAALAFWRSVENDKRISGEFTRIAVRARGAVSDLEEAGRRLPRYPGVVLGYPTVGKNFALHRNLTVMAARTSAPSVSACGLPNRVGGGVAK